MSSQLDYLTRFTTELPISAAETALAGLLGSVSTAVEHLVRRVGAPLRALPFALPGWSDTPTTHAGDELQRLTAAVRTIEQRLVRLEATVADDAPTSVGNEAVAGTMRKTRPFSQTLVRAKQVADARGLSAAAVPTRVRKSRR